MKGINVEHFVLNCQSLSFVDVQKYLGVLLTSNMTDDADIKRQIKATYAQGNALIKQFRKCSDSVKVKLFKAYCTNFYCMNLWVKCNVQQTFSKIRVAYNRIYRHFFQIKDQLGTSAHMCLLNVNHYKVIERKLVYSLRDRVMNSRNSIVKTIVSSLFFQSSQLNIRWNKILFNM